MKVETGFLLRVVLALEWRGNTLWAYRADIHANAGCAPSISATGGQWELVEQAADLVSSASIKAASAACQHDLQKPDTTIVVGTDETATDIYQSARCTVCGLTRTQAFPKNASAGSASITQTRTT